MFIQRTTADSDFQKVDKRHIVSMFSCFMFISTELTSSLCLYQQRLGLNKMDTNSIDFVPFKLDEFDQVLQIKL